MVDWRAREKADTLGGCPVCGGLSNVPDGATCRCVSGSPSIPLRCPFTKLLLSSDKVSDNIGMERHDFDTPPRLYPHFNHLPSPAAFALTAPLRGAYAPDPSSATTLSSSSPRGCRSSRVPEGRCARYFFP